MLSNMSTMPRIIDGHHFHKDLSEPLLHILNVKRMKIMFRIVFWDVLPCKIIVNQRFRGAYCLHHQG
jgi:hypothetical protein